MSSSSSLTFIFVFYSEQDYFFFNRELKEDNDIKELNPRCREDLVFIHFTSHERTAKEIVDITLGLNYSAFPF